MILETLKNSVGIAKRNYLLLLPTVVASLLVAGIVWISRGATTAPEDPTMVGEALGLSTLVGAGLGVSAVVAFIGGVIILLGHGMTVAMTHEAIRDGKTTLKSGFESAMQRVVGLVITAAVVGLLSTVGALLLILPGLIVAFLLMFAVVALIVDELGPIGALQRSVQAVIRHVGESFVVFLVLLALGVLFGFVAMILGLIPVVGNLLNVIIGGGYVALSSVLLVETYRSISESLPKPASESTGGTGPRQVSYSAETGAGSGTQGGAEQSGGRKKTQSKQTQQNQSRQGGGGATQGA